MRTRGAGAEARPELPRDRRSEDQGPGVNRRDAIRVLSAGVGAAASALWVTSLGALARERAPLAYLLSTASPPQDAAWAPAVFNAHQLETVGTLVELIIPTTDTPGARAARVDRYLDAVLASAPPGDREPFLAGLAWINTRSQALFGKDFVSASPAEQADLLTRLSTADREPAEASAGRDFFSAIKTMTIAGYYSTEIGLRQELGDDGRLMLATFEGCTHPEHQ
jgi:glucoside 3-dehydrogenase (cytochrome c) hitch-hiker subunit